MHSINTDTEIDIYDDDDDDDDILKQRFSVSWLTFALDPKQHGLNTWAAVAPFELRRKKKKQKSKTSASCFCLTCRACSSDWILASRLACSLSTFCAAAHIFWLSCLAVNAFYSIKYCFNVIFNIQNNRRHPCSDSDMLHTRVYCDTATYEYVYSPRR